MTLEATVTDLVNATTALHDAVRDKKTVLDNAAQQAAASLTATQSKQAEATASAAAAAASAATATSQAAEITAFKTAATALNTSTTATQAVTNLLPDMLAKKDPARHPFRNKLPSLVLDFERQKAHRYSDSTGFAETPLASLMTFTRNSTATYTGPDGVLRTAGVNQPRYDYDPVTGECKGLLIEEQRTNLVTYSMQSDMAGWNKTGVSVLANTIISPAGDLTGGTVSVSKATQSNIYKSVTLVVGEVYTTSVYVKAGNTNVVTIRMWRGPALAYADITLGTSAEAVHVGNGWYRCTITSTASDGTNGAVLVYPGGRTTQSVGNYVYIWGAQIEAGSFPTSYIPTPATFTGRASTATYLDANGVVQTAGVGVARSAAYDYDADGVLRPIGLLLEASATNLLLHSSDYTNAVWTKNFGGVGTTPVVTSAYGTAPDGTTTAQRVQLALNGGGSIDDYASISQSVTTVAGNTYTESVWLKTADASTKVVQLSFNGDVTQLLTVTGTWKRFSITGTALDTNRGFRLELRGTTGTSDSADLLMWGAQHGLGNYATSYIPTTTAQVTRAADSSTSAQVTRAADDATLTGANFSSWYNQEQGTLAGSVRLGSYTGNADSAGIRPGIAAVDDGTFNNTAHLGTTKSSAIRTNNTSVLDYQIGAVSANALVRDALRLQKANFIHAGDGALGASVNTGQVPRVNILRIGKSAFASGYANAAVRRVVYYPTAFTNEELQVLTSA